MLAIGQSYTLKVIKQVEFGFYLDAENLGEILLPKRTAPANLNLGDLIDVFLYLDSEDRPIATTKIPLVKVGQFAYLKVIETTPFGAFLDWGLDKHLLLPFAEQHRPLEVNHSYLIYAYIDKRDGRIVASAKIDKFLEDHAANQYKPQQEVNLIIANSTELGFKAIINHRHWGVLYKKELFKKIKFGQSVTGYIQQIRPDGKINLTLNGGYKTRDKESEKIVTYLKRHGGFAHLHDKSDPQEIAEALSMSKAAFKKAVGSLLKKGVLSIDKTGIRLLNHSIIDETKSPWRN